MSPGKTAAVAKHGKRVVLEIVGWTLVIAVEAAAVASRVRLCMRSSTGVAQEMHPTIRRVDDMAGNDSGP